MEKKLLAGNVDHDEEKSKVELAKINKVLTQLKSNASHNLIDSSNEEERRIQEEIKKGFAHFVIKNEDVPRKAAFTAFLLFIGGIILLIVAIMKAIEGEYSRITMVYFVAGILFFIPGLYFTCKIYKAFKIRDKNQRRDMLNDIPDM